MAWSFTAGAERALAEATGWTGNDDHDDLQPPELLIGLLAEAECRAAEMLLAHGVDVVAVRGRWPGLRRQDNRARREFAPALVAVIEAAIDRLWEHPRPLLLATEHLLLGLTAAPGETAVWLAEFGLHAQGLEEHITRLYGHDPGPLPVEAFDGPTAPNDRGLSAGAVSDVARPHPSPLPEGEGIADQEKLASGKSFAVPLLRVLDAAANRAREGLRVVEDYVRMVLDDRFLTGELKHLRHDLQQALRGLAVDDLLASRDTLADVGTAVSTVAESTRTDLASVAAANWKRLQEALRSLEEYAKVVDPAQGAAIERLRYRSYTLERAAEITRASVDRLALARVCVLTDGRGSEAEFERLIENLIAGGVRMIQLRDKKLVDGELFGRARMLRARTTADGVLCMINDRADIAAAVYADGVHVGQDDLPVKAARSVVGPRALVGVSTHSLAQARQAVLEGANYIGVGPTFPSATKQFDAFTGVELLRQVAAEIRLPAYAIGGVSLDNLDSVLAAGFSRVAVSGAMVSAVDPAATATEFERRLQTGT